MGGLAPGKLKSRRGGQVLSEAPSLIDSAVGRDSRTHWREKLYQLFRDWRLLIAIRVRRPGSFWPAKVAHSFAAADSLNGSNVKQRICTICESGHRRV